MTRAGPIQNFRGLAALILHAPDHNRSILERTLKRLGLTISAHDPAALPPPADEPAPSIDLVFVDADAWSTPPLPTAASTPIVALIGHESPTRLLRAYEMAASAFLLKPIRPQGVFTAVFFAVNEQQRRLELASKLESLATRHAARRHVIKAILLLMEQHGIDDDAAFRQLRKQSMRQRITIEDLSRHLVEQLEEGSVCRWAATKNPR